MLAIRRIAAATLAFALPPRCPGCGTVVAADHEFCAGCWGRLDFLGGAACPTCGTAIEAAVDAGLPCAACLAEPPAIDGLRAAVAYGPIARGLALRLKHGRRPGIARTMARFMARLVDPADAPLIAPVPLHRWRIWRRGFNQSALIARALARSHGIDLAVDLLVRTRPTPLLRGLGAAARARAVRGAFAIDPRWRDAVRGRTILLVDDVHTSGATANACARALKKAGAARVTLVCWARVGIEPPVER